MNSKNIYLDHGATTKVNDEVLKEMIPWFSNNYGNPSSIYSLGRKSKEVIENSRLIVANALNSKESEIYFTSCGTESNNWALKGICNAYKKKGNHIITTNIEHHSILHTLKYLEKQGFLVTYVPVEKNGIVSVEKIKKAIRKDTILITVMYANNEIGTIQPIKEIGKLSKEFDILFHTDAIQAAGTINIDVDDLNVDLLSISAHKFYGPKGVGALFVRRGIRIDNLLHGGAQEKTRRAATENIANIVGLAMALKIAVNNIEKYNKHIKKLRDLTAKLVIEQIPETIINGDMNNRLPGNINFAFRYIEGEGLLLFLDINKIFASSGSACTSGSLDPSHVLLAIGLPHEIAHGSLRLTYGWDNSEEDVYIVVNELKEIVKRLRDMSPLYDK
ncbi:MAG: cysteine desulfurase NifS [Clostridiales bacterium]|nr:cysteine desulfurase NifS [Clostridiales bacterium]